MKNEKVTGEHSNEEGLSNEVKAAVSNCAGKRLGIIGHVDHGKTTLTAAIAAMERGAKVVVVQKKPADITVNGVGYYQVTQKHHSSSVSKMMIMLSFYANAAGLNQAQTDILEGINIVKEFELIEQKKSSKSKRVRDAVVYCFNKNFQRVD